MIDSLRHRRHSSAMGYGLLRSILFKLDAEVAHRIALAALKLPSPRRAAAPGGALTTRVAGIDFPNPLGMAAGFDKDGEVPGALLRAGFGFVEVGSITPLPQAGNPRPRLFRLVEDRAVINRMGFNNRGAEAAVRRLSGASGPGIGQGIIGINIGANKDSADRAHDYVTMTRLMAPLAAYLAVNVSSPNTPGLRALQDEGALAALLDGVLAARAPTAVPVFLKVAPDLAPADIDAIARIAMDRRLDGLIVANTTISRPGLRAAAAGEAGGLSGAPLRALALKRLRDFRTATGGALPLIGVGGIATAADAWARIRAGASLVQLYTAMIYAGPGIARTITTGLEALMRRDGFATIAAAVGSE